MENKLFPGAVVTHNCLPEGCPYNSCHYPSIKGSVVKFVSKIDNQEMVTLCKGVDLYSDESRPVSNFYSHWLALMELKELEPVTGIEPATSLMKQVGR